MTNARPLAIAELKLADLARQISNTAYSFDTDSEVGKIINNAYFEHIGYRRHNVEITDKGDRELLRAYGAYLAEVAKALQTL